MSIFHHEILRNNLFTSALFPDHGGHITVIPTFPLSESIVDCIIIDFNIIKLSTLSIYFKFILSIQI